MHEIHTVVDELLNKLNEKPDDVLYHFLEWKDDKWVEEGHTNRELAEKSLATAYMLKKKGLKPGDRAVIFSMQDFGTMTHVFGCMIAGVVFTIIPPPIDESKIERFISVLKSCKPRALLSNFELEKQSGINITGRLLTEAFGVVIRMKRIYSDQLLPYKRTDIVEKAYAENLVYLQYTSGSTSAPKGVRVTWKNLMKNLEQIDGTFHFCGESMGTWVPFFHNLGLVITICFPITVGEGDVYFMNTLKFLENPKLWIKMMQDYNLRITVAPNSAYDACTRIFSEEEAKNLAIPNAAMLVNGSEFVSPATEKRFREMFGVGENAMTPGYGLAEATCLASVAMQDFTTLTLDRGAYENGQIVVTDSEENARHLSSVGRPVKDVKIRIGDAKTGEVFPEDRIGEIFVQGDNIADGYWGDIPDNKNFKCRLDGEDGYWYDSGDLGFLHDEQVYITGRAKELLIINGHNIYPNDILLRLQKKIPGMTQAAAFFSVRAESKENVIAVIEGYSTDDFAKKAADINHEISEYFGFSFYDIVFVPNMSLPRTDNTKLQVLKIKSYYEAKRLNVLYSSQSYSAGASTRIIDKSIDAADGILEQVEKAFEKVLGKENFSLTDSFLELGGDSFTGFELVSKIEQKFNIKMNLSEMLVDSSVMGITEYVRRIVYGGKQTRSRADIKLDCCLDETLKLSGEYDKLPGECRRVFLTGATGFLGARLVKEIIDQYPHEGLKLYCLVRASGDEAAKNRIINNMKHYMCWDDSYAEYIEAVTGDLSEPRFGIDDARYKEIAEDAEIIYHNGALLNFVFPYEYLREANVVGTRNALELAFTGKPKYFNYVSSYSVYDTPNNRGKKVYENDTLDVSKGFCLAYSETKWVSEKIVEIAAKRGLRTAVYRPGDITGSSNGIWEVEDLVSRMLVGMIQMKMVPYTSYRLHITPVDFVAKAIVCISRKEEADGMKFNLINKNPVTVPDAVSYVKECGYDVRYVTFPRWRKKLRSADTGENSLAILGCLFESGTESSPGLLTHFTEKDTDYDTSNASLLLNGTGITCPEIGVDQMRAYLNYFKSKGFIK